MDENRENRKDAGRLKSPLLFAFVLGGMLWGVILGVNLLGRRPVGISAAQFGQLEEDGLLERIEMAPEGLYCRLSREIRMRSGDREAVREVFLPSREGRLLKSGSVDRWIAEGIQVAHIEGRGGGEYAGTILLILLIGIGVWNLWSQIQRDRNGEGSPRRRLKRLREAFLAGKIDEQEYRRRVEAIWTEM